MNDSLQKALRNANKGEHFPVLNITRDNPEMAAILSKAIKGKEAPAYDEKGNLSPTQPDVGAMRNLGMRKAQDITDAETVLQVLPDLKRTKQILISSILAPKDMITVELNYTTTEGLLPPEVSSEMMNAIKTHLDQDYKITPKLADIFGDALFDKGAYPIAVIPENALDDVINGGRRIAMESMSDHFTNEGMIRPIGLLGPAVKREPTPLRMSNIAVESLGAYTPNRDVGSSVLGLEHAFGGKPQETFITVTDNPSLLKIPTLQQRIREQRVMGTVFGNRPALEAYRDPGLNDRKLIDLIYKNRQFKYNPITTMKTQDQLNRRSVGNPLVMHIPPESVIPVYMPGNVSEHLGYFILCDAEGNPLARGPELNQQMDVSTRLSTASSFPSALLNKVKGEMQGFDPWNQNHLDFSARIFGQMVEQELLARMRNGVYGEGATIAKRDSVYRIMMARALAKQHTQLLFLPVEMMTYIAFDHDDNGVGKSLMDDMKIINGLRSALLFANVMAGIKNSIGRTEVKITLDEHDPDPFKTEELIKHEVVRARQKTLPPVGLTSPTDIVDHLNLASLEFITEGHPGMPDIRVDFGEKNNNYTKVDTELADDLRKNGIMSTGVPPELVDAGIPIEFATTAVANNILLSKQVITFQDKGTPQISNHIRQYISASEKLLKELSEILEKHKDKLGTRIEEYVGDKQVLEGKEEEVAKFVLGQLLVEFIAGFEVNLPRPNSVTLENQIAAMETQAKALDAALEYIISDQFFTSDTGGEVAQQVTTLRALAKAQYMRQFMSDNGILPELSQLTATNEDGSPVMDIYNGALEHVQALTKTFAQFMVGIQPIKKAADVVMQNAVGQMDGGSSGSETDDNSGDDSSGGGSGDDFNLDDNFGGALNDDAAPGGDEATATPEANEGGEGKDEGGVEPAEPESDANKKKPEGTSEEEPKE